MACIGAGVALMLLGAALLFWAYPIWLGHMLVAVGLPAFVGCETWWCVHHLPSPRVPRAARVAAVPPPLLPPRAPRARARYLTSPPPSPPVRPSPTQVLRVAIARRRAAAAVAAGFAVIASGGPMFIGLGVEVLGVLDLSVDVLPLVAAALPSAGVCFWAAKAIARGAHSAIRAVLQRQIAVYCKPPTREPSSLEKQVPLTPRASSTT